jgi:uncharacterized membrane protein YidH (DUF202 family)
VIRRARERVPRSYDEGLPDERTALGWERTAISTMVTGALIARFAATSLHWAFGLFGLMVVAAGGALLVWAGWRYDELRHPIEPAYNPAHPTATRLVGGFSVLVTAMATALAVAIALDD